MTDVAVVLDDAAIRPLESSWVVEVIRGALLAHGRGELIGPPRLSAPLGDDERDQLVFTAGAGPGYAGFRVYGTGALGGLEQAVLVWPAGAPRPGLVLGEELGRRRTAAIGAVAADLLAPADAGVLGLVGSGAQAQAHLWALAAVRALRDVRVHSPNPAHREALARWGQAELGIDCRAVASPRDAVDGADLVTLATRSRHPVIEADWLTPGAHVTTLGPKAADAHECPTELAADASVIATDSSAQMRAYPDRFFLRNTDLERVFELGALLADEARSEPDPAAVTLFCSVGLAGTEAALAAAAIERLR